MPVKSYEGKAGMIALVSDGNLDLAALRAHAAKSLPEYAWPLFICLKRELDVTGTFKQKKADLAREGFDPLRVNDEIYFSDAVQKAYVSLDSILYEKILTKGFRH